MAVMMKKWVGKQHNSRLRLFTYWATEIITSNQNYSNTHSQEAKVLRNFKNNLKSINYILNINKKLQIIQEAVRKMLLRHLQKISRKNKIYSRKQTNKLQSIKIIN